MVAEEKKRDKPVDIGPDLCTSWLRETMTMPLEINATSRHFVRLSRGNSADNFIVQSFATVCCTVIRMALSGD